MQKHFRNFVSVVVGLLASITPFGFAWAQTDLPPEVPAGKALSLTEITGLINATAKFVTLLGIVLAVIYIVWGGIAYITAGGDDAKVKTATARIKNGIIGVAVVLGVGIIIRTVSDLLSRNFFGYTP